LNVAPCCTSIAASYSLTVVCLARYIHRFNVSHAAVQQMVPLNTSLAGCSATYIKSDPSMVARDGSIGSLRSGLVLEGQDALGVDSVIKRTRSVQAKYLRALAAPAVIRKGYKRMPYPGLKAQASQEFGVDAEEALMLAALPDAWDNTNPAVVGGPAFVAPARDQVSFTGFSACL
jgi:hypothetical protein